jgi:hypothetical protein
MAGGGKRAAPDESTDDLTPRSRVCYRDTIVWLSRDLLT